MDKTGAAFCAFLGLMHAPAMAQNNKPIVAIYEMQDNTRPAPQPQPTAQYTYGYRYQRQAEQRSQSAPTGPSALSIKMQDMLSQAIVATNKFSVIERSQLRYLLNEQVKGRSGLLTTDTPEKFGGFEGADFLIYGSINQANTIQKTLTQVSENKNYGLSALGSFLSGGRQPPQPKQFEQSCAYELTTLSINIKIVDAQTGEVRYSAPVDQQGITATKCPGGQPVSVAEVERLAAQKLAFKLVTAIYPMQVASVLPDNTFVINYGEGLLATGNLISVYSKGQEIRDPSTGELIGNDEIKIGVAQVTEVNAKFSKARPIYGYGSPDTVLSFSAPLRIGSIVRLSNEQELQEVASNLKKYQAELEAAQKKKH